MTTAPIDTSPARVYTAEEQQLMDRLRNADIGQLKAFVREVLAEGLPPDYVIPPHIAEAGSPRMATEAINDRYPQFYGLEGREFLEAIARDPVAYKEMMREGRALRVFYQEEIRAMKGK